MKQQLVSLYALRCSVHEDYPLCYVHLFPTRAFCPWQSITAWAAVMQCCHFDVLTCRLWQLEAAKQMRKVIL